MSKKERELTPAEQKRKADFEKICEDMEQNGYRKKDLTVGILKANIMALLIMLPFSVIELVLFILFHKITGPYPLSWCVQLIIADFIQIVLHEAIHGLTWGIFAKSHFKAIRFGVIWKALTPYCTCAEPLTKWQYILGAAMPTLILGFGQAAIALASGSTLLLVLSVVLTLSGGGDFYIILLMLTHKSKSKNAVYYDHPYEGGVVIFEKE